MYGTPGWWAMLHFCLLFLGMATTHLHHLQATTIHKLCALLDGRYANKELANMIMNSTEHSHTKQTLQTMDTLIIDEVSMLSKTIFEEIEYVLRTVRGNATYFGGVQLILSGDFYQLPPIAKHAYGDDGKHCFLSDIWADAIPHHVQLEQVHRQDEQDLVAAIRQLSLGHADVETCKLMTRWLLIMKI